MSYTTVTQAILKGMDDESLKQLQYLATEEGKRRAQSASSELGRLAGTIKGKHEDAEEHRSVEERLRDIKGIPKPGISLREVDSAALMRIIVGRGPKCDQDEINEMMRRLKAAYRQTGGDVLRSFARAEELGVEPVQYKVGSLYEVAGDGDRLVPKAEIGAQIHGYGAKTATEVDADDRHVFSSGAMSSGKKPNYLGTMPQFAYERFAKHRGYGDAKYGEDNYRKGTSDRAFILDRINHGIEHLLRLGAQVKAGNTGNWTPGEDDAAAVMCAGMFVMCWQHDNRDEIEVAESKTATEMSWGKQAAEEIAGASPRKRNPDPGGCDDHRNY